MCSSSNGTAVYDVAGAANGGEICHIQGGFYALLYVRLLLFLPSAAPHGKLTYGANVTG